MADEQSLHKKPRFTRPDSPKRKRVEVSVAGQDTRRLRARADNEEDGVEDVNNSEKIEDRTAHEGVSRVAPGLASLVINDNRRQGLYGAKAFGREPQQPELDEDRMTSTDTTSHNQQSSQNLRQGPPYLSMRAQQPVPLQSHTLPQQQVRVGAEPTQKGMKSHHPPGLTTKSRATCATSNLQATGTHIIRSSQRSDDHSARLHPMTGGLRLPGVGKVTRQAARLDDDRDHEGNLLPRGNQPFFSTGRPRVVCAKEPQEIVADNLYSSAGRLESALKTTNLKRKHTVDVLPPHAFVYKRINDPNFNVFHGFLLYPELCYLLANEMPIKDLISLYAISTDFHIIIDSRFTTVCLGQAMLKAPDSAKTFFYRTYKQLCRRDPEARIAHPDPSKAAQKIARRIPSFRWVQMVIYREKLVHEIMAVFAEYGCPLPARCELAIKRMWYLMDMPSNAMRIGAIHNHNLITDLDLYFAMTFFVKLDMICNDPVAPEKRDGLRKLMLSMPDGLTTVHRVLTRQRWRHRSDMMVAWIRHTLEIPTITDNVNGTTPEQLGVSSVLSVPVREVGLLKYEHWGNRGRFRPGIAGDVPDRFQFLLRPDQLVMREAIRRGLRFHKHILRCVLYGYIDPATLENYPPRNWPRRIPEYKDEEYGMNDAVGGIRAPSREEGGDPLLDVGDSYAGSRYTHVPEKPHDWAEQIKAANDVFLDYMEWWQMQEVPKQETDDLPAFEELRD